MDVSNNSLTTYRICQKKYYWNYIERLVPRYKDRALTLGGIVHEAFDMYYSGKDKTDIIAWINDTYKEERGRVGIEEQEDLYLDTKTALGMFINFPFTEMKFQDILPEEEFNVELDQSIDFKGRVDGKVKYDDRWWIREVKTTGSDISAFEKRASVSAQVTGYVYAIEKRDKHEIEGVIFDYLRKPKLYKRRDECMEEFGQRIYQDYCDKKKKKHYFGRYPTWRSPHAITLWLSDARRTAHQIRRSCDNLDFPRNTNACYAWRQECPYKKICFNEHIDPLIIELFYTRKEEIYGGSKEGVDPSGEAGGGDRTAEDSAGERGE